MSEKSSNRIAFISFLQFIGVVSVIFGHSMNSIPVPAVLTNIKAWIYTFHMPLFFFVSAFLFSYKGGYKQGYKNVLGKRFFRLIIPYIIWNIAFLFPKMLLFSTLPDQIKAPELSFSYAIEMMLYPRNNILGHTWFLFALFEMFLVAIILDKMKEDKKLWIPVLAILIIANCMGISNRLLAIEDLMKNGAFFWIGMIVGTYSPDKANDYMKDKVFDISIILLSIITTVIWVLRSDLNINTLVLGVTLLFLFMMIQSKLNINCKLIEFVSRNSFPIYIMHWPVIMILRLVFFQKLGIQPIVAMIINFVLGFAIPWAIVVILRKITAPWFKKICTVVFGM